MDSSELKSILLDLQSRIVEIRNGIFDVSSKEKRLNEISDQLSKEEVWSNLDLSQKLSKEKVSIEKSLTFFQSTEMQVSDNLSLLEMALEESDLETIKEIAIDISTLQKSVEDLEFSRMFTNKMDPNNAYIDIQSGAGGTEAQDWAEMLFRMYLRWAEAHNYKIDVIEVSAGDVAGIKSATIHVSGDYVYGWLRTETGVHRLVRK